MLRALFLVVGGGAYLFFAGFALLWASDVIMSRAVWWGPFLAGWAVMAAVGRFLRRPRAALWVLGGLLGLGCCVAAANFVWPLSNPTHGGFLSGRGVANYVLLPWLHTAFWVVVELGVRGPGRPAHDDERLTG